MSFEDKTIQCSDCGVEFVFTAEEQELFDSRGYTHDPKRCSTCREARKAERYESTGSYRGRREMFPAVCAQCGQNTQVPFKPSGERPVYCSDCYNKIKISR